MTTPTAFSPSLPVRRIGINAFGYGGTNGHAIIDNIESLEPDYRNHTCVHQPSSIPNASHKRDLDRPYLLVFSAHNKATLKRNLTAHSRIGHKVDLFDLAYTLSARRTKHSSRTFAICRKQSFPTDFAVASERLIEQAGLTTVAFTFTGQGAQWPQMGVNLFGLYPSFLHTIKELDSFLARLSDAPEWTLEAALRGSAAPSRIYEAELSQPLCTVVQIGLVKLLKSWGVIPIAIVGHSSGEIAAAYAAGIVSAEGAITVA